jgi:hypothetical protein
MKNRKFEFSKLLIIFETIIIGYITYKTMNLIELAIANRFDATLPYLTTTISVAWAAYGTSAGFYYNKAKTENMEKIKNTNRDC